MAKRRVWESLSGDYRARLSRSGITREAYESGISLKGARGHSKTPERPEEAIRNPARYPEYVERAASLQKEKRDRVGKYFNNKYRLLLDVFDRNESLHGNRLQWHYDRAKENLFRGVVIKDKRTGEERLVRPGVKELRRFLATPESEWERYISAAAHLANQGITDDWAALFYH